LGSGIRSGEERTFRNNTEAGEFEYSKRLLFSSGELLAGGSDVCPPAGFDALKDFDINSYYGRWYIHKQIPVAYQTVDQLFCVTAEYSRDTNFCLFCNSLPRIDIINRARQDSVTGESLAALSRFSEA
jgi:lipocalin